MDDFTTPGRLELEVANFGPIVKAKIDLRPLTVFVGPSNTGKSYLAILIYALHRFCSGDGTWPARRPFHFRRDLTPEPPPTVTDALVEWAEHVDLKKVNDVGPLALPASVVDAIHSVFPVLGEQLGSAIVRSFGIDDVGSLTRKGQRKSASVVLRGHDANNSPSFEHGLTLKAQGTEFGTTTPEGTSIRIDFGRGDWRMGYLHNIEDMLSTFHRTGKERGSVAWDLMEKLIDLVLPQFVGLLSDPAFYLPADRTGVMHAHSVVVNALIGSAPMAGLRPAVGTPMLSGVLADFLQQLIQIDRPSYRRGTPRVDLGSRIEEAILGGSVHVDRSEVTGYPHFTYQPKEWKTALPLMNASSMVSELAPVILYLRHVVQPGGTLIVEEPESHLHPAMQVEFTRQLAALVHKGVRVVVTTHSDWVLETLANLVRSSELPKAQRKGIQGADLALRPDQIGAWLFKPNASPKGSVVEEVRFDPDAGGLESDYSEVAEQLHNDWATIGNRITGSSE